MAEVYLVDGARTPPGRYGGALAEVRADDLAGLVVAEAVRRAGVPADRVDEVPVPRRRGGDVVVDETPRPDTTMDRLAGLPTIFRDGGVVTAGSSSPLTDGAAALVVASESAVREHGLRVRARIVGSASAGVAPNVMGLGPVPATQKVLGRAGWGIDDLDAVELNKAFAAQSLGVIRQLKLDEDIVNSDGGAIALGHPLGASGARIVLTLLGRMERENARCGLATLCVGVAQGVSMLIEAV